MTSASIRAVAPVTTEPGDPIPLWPSNGHHVGAEDARSGSLLAPRWILRAWAQAAKYLAERHRAAESKQKDNLPLNDPWAEGARTPSAFFILWFAPKAGTLSRGAITALPWSS